MSAHTVTVTAVPNMDEDLPEDQYIDQVQYTVVCPGDGQCYLWWECKQCIDDKHEPTDDEEDEGEYFRHGIEHQNIEGDWMTPSTQCAAIHSDSCSDALQEEAEHAGVGTHQIELDYEGDGSWSARLILSDHQKATVDARAQELLAEAGNREWGNAGSYIQNLYRSVAWDELKK
jgi:hypothetical protein